MNRCEKLAEYLIKWYPDYARDLPWRRDTEPYHVWLSEIMLQQTRVEAVKAYYKRFLNELPTIEDLAEAEEERLLKLWEGLGYYNRARNLKRAAVTIVNELNGKFPDTYEGILALSGIGEYTAGAIGSICFDLPTPAVDGNVLRVYSRVMEDDSNIDRQSTKKKIRTELEKVYSKGKCGIFTQSLMELGAIICLPKGEPKCMECPVSEICLAGKHDTWKNFPVREVKKKRSVENKTVFMLICDDRIAVRKRPEKGLLAGMWEFPNVRETLSEQQAADVVTDWHTAPEQVKMRVEYTHIFSHVEWRMVAYYMTCKKMCPEFEWVTLQELDRQIAVPSAFKEFKEKIEFLYK